MDGVRGPHNFSGAPVAQTATTKFGTKVITATYYRSDCDHGLYGSASCCISQCPVHYPIKFDALNIMGSPKLVTFFFSHNLKIQDSGGCHLGSFRLCDLTIPAC